MLFIRMKNKEEKIGHAAFIDALTKTLPEIAGDVLDEDNLGYITLQISWLTSFTRKAVERNDIEIIQKSFRFIEKVYSHASDDVSNAIVVSYLMKLGLENNHSVKSMLSQELETIHDKMIIEYTKPLRKDIADFLAGMENQFPLE